MSKLSQITSSSPWYKFQLFPLQAALLLIFQGCRVSKGLAPDLSTWFKPTVSWNQGLSLNIILPNSMNTEASAGGKFHSLFNLFKIKALRYNFHFPCKNILVKNVLSLTLSGLWWNKGGAVRDWDHNNGQKQRFFYIVWYSEKCRRSWVMDAPCDCTAELTSSPGDCLPEQLTYERTWNCMEDSVPSRKITGSFQGLIHWMHLYLNDKS